MLKADAQEAAPIMDRALLDLLAAAPTRGRPGSDLRAACGALISKSAALIQADKAGQPLADCFGLAVKAGISQKQVSYVRHRASAEQPVSLGAVLIKNAIIKLSLATEGRAIANMKFTSRGEVDALRTSMNVALNEAEEIAADDMDAMTYRALVQLHAAVTNYLVETARPLPRMIRFAFATPMPALVMTHRLYYDAGRADELCAENGVVHPAFMLPTGRALSA